MNDEEIPPTGTVNLNLDEKFPEVKNVPEVEAKLTKQVEIAPNAFAAILEPTDEGEMNGAFHLIFKDSTRIKKESIVVASICKGHTGWTHVDKTSLQIYNVVPHDTGELVIRIGIFHGPVIYRVHIIVFNPLT